MFTMFSIIFTQLTIIIVLLGIIVLAICGLVWAELKQKKAPTGMPFFMGPDGLIAAVPKPPGDEPDSDPPEGEVPPSTGAYL